MLSKERGKVHLGALDSTLITQSQTQFNLERSSIWWSNVAITDNAVLVHNAEANTETSHFTAAKTASASVSNESQIGLLCANRGETVLQLDN